MSGAVLFKALRVRERVRHIYAAADYYGPPALAAARFREGFVARGVAASQHQTAQRRESAARHYLRIQLSLVAELL